MKRPMIKYVIQHVKGAAVILETEVALVTQAEDPSIAWRLKPGECIYNILRPMSLAGECWMSFAFYDSEAEARTKLESSLREVEAPRAARHGQVISEEEILSRLAAIRLQTL